MRFKSMPNFRRLADGRGAAAPAGAEGDPVVVRLNVFRSSRPDFLTADEIEQFQSAGIRSIIDFRSTTEYRKASGLKLLDRFYPPHKVIENESFFMKSHPEYCLKMHRRSTLEGANDVLTGQKMCQHKQPLHKVGLCSSSGSFGIWWNYFRFCLGF